MCDMFGITYDEQIKTHTELGGNAVNASLSVPIQKSDL